MKYKFKRETFFILLGSFSLLCGLIILVIFVIKLSNYYSISSSTNKLLIEDTGKVGEFIGGVVGTLLSFGSVFFIILTLIKQNEAFLTQRNQFDIQQFENKFFQLLKVQQDIFNTIEIKFAPPTEKTTLKEDYYERGLNAFEHIYLRLKKQYYKIQEISLPDKPIPFEMKNLNASEEEEQKNKVQDAFEKLSIVMEIKNISTLNTPHKISTAAYSLIFGTFNSQLGHYFRHLNHILKYVNQSYLNENKKNKQDSQEIFLKYKNYVDLLQAQMSSYQLAILFYHGLCFKEMKELLHLYNFLSSLTIQDLVSEEHKDFYCATNIDGINYPAILLKDRNEIIEIE